ncbi:GPP34 family phosphoprotein [Micromonospora sp. NPDC047730]|uniref:GPP34 family phosphoprotein n=1 Tax=Micromonospora sp. NPDC047730 TaxID=3364253 RepID=UPI0037150D5B
MPLADDFYLLTHSDTSGRPYLNTRAIALGLAAALLAELVMENKLKIGGGRVVPVSPVTPPSDALAHMVFEQIVRDPQHHDLRTWLSFLSVTSYDQVAMRLVHAGRLRRAVVRGLLRQREELVPVDSSDAARPAVMLVYHATRRLDFDLAGLTLAYLVDVTGMTPVALEAADPNDIAYLRRQLSRLWPPMRELGEEVRTAIGDAVLSHRM